MSVIRWEMEYYRDNRWYKVGFTTRGGFTPYRYEYRADAEWTLLQLHPNDPRRVVRAESVLEESNQV